MLAANVWVFIFLITIPQESLSQLKIPTPSFLNQELKTYFLNYKSHTPKQYNFCIYLNIHNSVTRDISDWFIKNNCLCSSVIPSNLTSKIEYFPSSHATFIFLQHLTDVDHSIRKLRGYSFWNQRGENHFVLCSQVNDTKFLPSLLDSIWRRHLLKFVFILVHRRLEIFTYNPFKNNEIIDLRRDPNCYDNLFADKLSNLYGYEFRVSLFEYVPILTKHDGRWYGKDFNLLQLVTSAKNASFRVIEASNKPQAFIDSYLEVIEDRADFCFNSLFIVRNHITDKVDSTYPHVFNKVVILMPFTTKNIKRQTHNLASIFTLGVWILIIMLTILTSIVLTVARKANCLFSESLIYSFACLLGYSFYRFNTQYPFVKFQLMMFILGSIILRTAYNSFLVSSFVSPYSSDKITTIKQLKEQNINVVISKELASMIPRELDLHKKLIVVSIEKRAQMMYDLNTRVAYAVTQTHANLFIAWVKEHMATVPFYIIEEPVMQGFDVYVFQKHSPFVQEMNLFLLRDHQYVLSNQYEAHHEVFRKNYTEHSNYVALSMHHLYPVFYLLFGGLVLSALMFFSELVRSKM